MMKKIFLGLAIIAMVGTPSVQANEMEQTKGGLVEAFASPPDSAKPWVYMWRSHGKLTPEDITRHINQIKEKGFGGFILYGGAPGSVSRSILPQLLRECEGQGLTMGANITGGWPSGGPWISRGNRPWATVYSTCDMEGGKPFNGKLPEPVLPTDGSPEFMTWLKQHGVATIAVQAFRLPADPVPPRPVITVSSDVAGIPALFDGNWNTGWIPQPETDKTVKHPWVLFDFGAPRQVDTIWFDSRGDAQIQSSEDKITFKNVFTPKLQGYSEFPPVTARYFRVVFTGLNFTNRFYGKVNELALGTRKEVERRAVLATKTGLVNWFLPVFPTDLGFRSKFTTAHVWSREDFELPHQPLLPDPSDQILSTKTLIDLTAKIGPDGYLHWDVPPGKWRIIWLRRCVANGHEFIPDYLNPEATREDFEKEVSLLGKVAGKRAGKIFRYYHEDNNEIHCMYNWTPKMLEEFHKRRNYDARPYLAALAGQIVDSLEITDRFLNDLRRTMADCVAENRYGLWRNLADAQGVQTRAEAAGPYFPFTPSHDGMANLSRVDLVVGEFWSHSCSQQNWLRKDGKLIDPTASFNQRYRFSEWQKMPDRDRLREQFDEGAQNINVKMAASTAHIYGKKLVDTEAFTSLMNVHAITLSDLLLRANVAFCEGVNHMCFHASDTTAASEGSPGTVYAAGTYFNDRNTWWPYVGAFVQYIQRCSALLQRGRFVADLLYYIGDEVPAMIHPKHIRTGGRFGYDYDDCNSEALLTRFSVRDRKLVTPEGLSYRVLVLPERRTMTLPVARKIRELVLAGAVVVGPRPLRTPGLTDYPRCDQELKTIADELWDSGKVISNKTESEVLAALNVPVDFAFMSSQPDALMDFIHRQDKDEDIYFVINRRNRTERFEVSFRVTGREPELLDPLTGRCRNVSTFTANAGQTTLPLELAPYGSMFVVFQKPTTEKKRQGRAFQDLKMLTELSGAWEVKFDPKWGGPEDWVRFGALADWTSHKEEGVKYYSGTAVYRTRFEMSKFKDPGAEVYLDLGVVKDLAAVRLNGKSIGVAWCPPWRLETSQALREGVNELEIAVVNTWHNRLQLDQSQPAAKRLMDFGYKYNGKPGPQRPLLPAGLLGPVRVMIAEK